MIFSLGCDEKKDLSYDRITTGKWVGANVVSKKASNRVMWFQFFDQQGEKNTYTKTKKKVLGFPAKVFDNKHIWILINDRFEIRLMADSKEESYQDNEKLTAFLSAFDLEAMKSYTGKERVPATELRKWIPKIEGFDK